MKVSKDKIECSIEEWDCYDNELCQTPPEVVVEVNDIILEVLSSTHSPKQAQERIYELLRPYYKYGFGDSECRQVATIIINKYYNSDIDRWSTSLQENNKINVKYLDKINKDTAYDLWSNLPSYNDNGKLPEFYQIMNEANTEIRNLRNKFNNIREQLYRIAQ